VYKLQTITHINFAKGFRGGERQTLLLIQELSLRGYKQKLITRETSLIADRANKIKDLEIIRTKKPYFLYLRKTQNSEVLHAHESKAAQYAFMANLFFNIPYIITRRVDNPIRNNLFNKRKYQNSFYTVALSNAIKYEIKKVSPKSNTEIIPSCSTPFKINQEQVRKIRDPFKEKFLIANIGELDNKHKGQIYLLEAMRELSKKYPEMHLLLLGKGRDKNLYEEITKDLTNITFEGFVENVGDYITVLDLFVFPSLNEGLGSILLDVMSAGKPIIASNIGGIPEIIHDNQNGLLIPSKDSKAIYQAIEKLYLDKKLRDSLALEALKSSEKYTPAKMAEKYIRLYKSLL
jgi:glycosyltransferase involved in cell wall biosynthesis